MDTSSSSNQGSFVRVERISRQLKIAALVAVVIVVGAAGWYGYQEWPWFHDAQEIGDAPRLPREPKDANDELKGMYAEAMTAHEARLKDATYPRFLEEGLAWKTVAEFAPEGQKKDYFLYSAYVYAQAGEAYPTEWIPYLDAGNVFAAMKEFGRAEQSYKKAAEIAPDRGEILIALLEMIQTAQGGPTAQLTSYMANRLPELKFDGGQFTLLYAKFLLEAGYNKEALDALRVGSTTFKDDPRVAQEYADVKKTLEKRGYKEELPTKVD